MKIAMTLTLAVVSFTFGCAPPAQIPSQDTRSESKVQSKPLAVPEPGDLWEPADTNSIEPSSDTLLYYPRITKASGKVVYDRIVHHRYKYLLVTDDGSAYLLDILKPPAAGLDKKYTGIGVRLVATPEQAEKLEREAAKSLLPGQTIPENPFKDVLYDVSLTPVEE